MPGFANFVFVSLVTPSSIYPAIGLGGLGLLLLGFLLLSPRLLFLITLELLLELVDLFGLLLRTELHSLRRPLDRFVELTQLGISRRKRT